MKLSQDTKVRLPKVLNILLMMLIFAAAWELYYSGHVLPYEFYRRGNWVVIGLYGLIYAVLVRAYDAFLISQTQVSDLIFGQVLASLFTNIIYYPLLFLLIRHPPYILPLLAVQALEVAVAVVWSHLTQRWFFKTFPPISTMVIYDMREGVEDLINEYGMARKFRVEKIQTVGECLEENMKTLRDIHPGALFIFGVHSHERNIILKYCIQERIEVYVIPRIGDLVMGSAVRMHMFHLPVLRVRRYNPSFEYDIIKRAMDLVFSALLLILLSPLFLVLSILIRGEDGGPVFYKQTRLTKDGRLFQIYKFRSMRTDAEKDGKARLSTGQGDSRVTKIGRFIRSCRMDELPQLLNVFRGEMSFVGPRPERPEIAAEYEKELPEFALRLQAKAGMTGYAQVYGKYNTTPYDKLQMDLMYIAQPSIWEDLKIMMATVRILFSKESTEGVTEENDGDGKPEE